MSVTIELKIMAFLREGFDEHLVHVFPSMMLIDARSDSTIFKVLKTIRIQMTPLCTPFKKTSFKESDKLASGTIQYTITGFMQETLYISNSELISYLSIWSTI